MSVDTFGVDTLKSVDTFVRRHVLSADAVCLSMHFVGDAF
jgi:hypothetical protein